MVAQVLRDRLRQLYYLQTGWKATQGLYFVSGTSPGWPEGGAPGPFRAAWGFEGTPHTYVSWIRLSDGRTRGRRSKAEMASASRHRPRAPLSPHRRTGPAFVLLAVPHKSLSSSAPSSSCSSAST